MQSTVAHALRLTAVLAAAITATTSAAGAQSLDRLRFGVAAGANLERGGDPGLALLGSVEVGHLGSPLGVRGELLFTQRSDDRLYPAYFDGTYYPYPSPYVPSAALRERRIAALLSGTYEFRQGALVRPFLLGGAGAYFTKRTVRVTQYTYPYPINCPPGMVCAGTDVIVPAYRATSDDANLGLHLGLGTSFDLGRLQVVTQARYHLLDGDNGGGRVIPLMVGLRF